MPRIGNQSPQPEADSTFGHQRVTVMGLGRFGGGAAAARFLAERGAAVTITDLRPAEELSSVVASLADVPIAGWRLGEHCLVDFTETDLVVVNPAVPPDSRWVDAARSAGVLLSSEIELFCQRAPGTVVAVTGSNGKSTTAALIHHILRRAGRRVWLGGNIGHSLLGSLPEMNTGDWVILELSSFQLTALDRIRFRPHIAVVTNFTPNHLDWHPDVDHYRWAKQRILHWQRASDWAVLNASDTEVRAWPAAAQRLEFAGSAGLPRPGLTETPEQLIYRDSHRTETLGRNALAAAVQLPGLHNRENVSAALTAACAAGVSLRDAVDALAGFEPLAHRLEFVAEHEGRRYINDSLATTPESAIAALHAFEQPIVLLAGGSDKGVDLTDFARAIARRAKAVALMGQTGPQLAQALQSHPGKRCRWATCSDFRSAFAWAVGQSCDGDIILLSPGCASFGWFESFADRGQQFREAVHRLDRS